MFTSADQHAIRHPALAAGADGVVDKTADLDDLFGTLLDALSERAASCL